MSKPEIFTRAAPVSGTADPDARTVQVTFATSTPVKRYSWDDGYYLEVLEISRDAIDASRMNEGMSLLDTHDQNSMDSRLGSVVPGSFKIVNGEAVATVKFSRRERADQYFQDILDGHKTPISVGYKVLETRKTEGQGDTLPTVTATKWMPLEISVVPVPADSNASTRSEGNDMPNRHQHSPSTPSEVVEQQRSAVEAERVRAREIQAIARNAGFSDEDGFVSEALESDTTVEAFRSQLLDKVLAGGGHRSPRIDTYRRQDETDTRRQLVANAILHRHNVVAKLEDGANEWRGLTALDIVRETLKRSGQDWRGSPAEVVQRALHTTSDFAYIMNAVTNQTLLAAYAAYENTFQLFATRAVVNDFREQNMIDIGSAPDLLPVGESGEFKSGTIRESAESIKVNTFGRKIGLTRQMLINDQIGAFTQAVANWGRKAAKLEGDIVWNVIISNLKLKDGKELFHADHGNLATTGTALDETSLIEARRAFRRQKDIDGQPIDMTPKYLFVGADLEITAQKLITGTTVPTSTADVVPAAIKSMVPVYEPRLDALGAAWFLFADAASTMGRGLQYAYLSGFEKPRTNERMGFDVEGIEYTLAHDFGAGLTDYRFAYKNPGQ
ncbi:Mu-like prophage major head subunit gpT family protein [Brucella oryzae]|uniref:prohead protease/major capsid protein fusion protein n=1 Tax=Brucella oryzae TaxID=335286 RepID=UPI001B8207C7|nr:prohead protease/major capsid protein fusion protein [Brucella oryzae]MBR7651524.1 Mu-like prophage major head subunit gpT family protein [Brucella oryzae]